MIFSYKVKKELFRIETVFYFEISLYKILYLWKYIVKI